MPNFKKWNRQTDKKSNKQTGKLFEDVASELFHTNNCYSKLKMVHLRLSTKAAMKSL